MSKNKEIKYVKQYFTEAPPGTGYHANHVHDVPEKQAREFQKQGYCRNATQTLPEDLPGRDSFLEAGIETMDEITDLEDPTEINGIGDATAKELAEWLAENN